MADIRAQADRKIHEQNEALARIQAQAAAREAELTSQLEEYRAIVAYKARAIFELQSSLDNALDWHRRREESHRQQEERLIAENEELQSQRVSFKEIVGKHVPPDGTGWKMQRTGPDRYRPIGKT